MYVIGFDTETTGLDVKKDQIIEVGLVVWDTVTNKPVFIYNALLKPSSGLLVNQEIESLTGISNKFINDFGREPVDVYKEVLSIMEKTPIIICHNAHAYDKPIFKNNLERAGFSLPKLKWIDTMTDVPYPKLISVRKLTYLGVEHGILNPFAHRAVTDVLTMMKVCANYSWDEIFKLANSPTVTLQAMVTMQAKDLAKNRGYYWNPDEKIWYKKVKEAQVDDELTHGLFNVKTIGVEHHDSEESQASFDFIRSSNPRGNGFIK